MLSQLETVHRQPEALHWICHISLFVVFYGYHNRALSLPVHIEVTSMLRKTVAVLVAMLVLLALSACTRSIVDTPQAEAPVVSEPEADVQEAVIEAEMPADNAAVEAAAEVEEPYDPAAYGAAAQAVRDEYIQVIQAGAEALGDYDENAHPELPWYTAVLLRYAENRYFEGYYDFDGNGIPEMLIATGDDSYMTTLAVYAFDGQSVRYLCKDHPLGERSYLSLVDDLFVVHGSGGAASGILAIYRIAEDGWGTDLIDVIDYQYSDEQHVTYTPQLGNISPDEVVSRGLAKSFGLDIDVDWQCFYPA